MTIWAFWCTEVALPKSETTVSCLSAVCTPKTSIKFRNEWSLIVESEWGCSEMLAIFSSEALICYRTDLTLFISLPKTNSFETKNLLCWIISTLHSFLQISCHIAHKTNLGIWNKIYWSRLSCETEPVFSSWVNCTLIPYCVSSEDMNY